jgi:hypothetical protein
VILKFEFPEERIKELEWLRIYLNLEDMEMLFNNALSIFVWCVKEGQKGNNIAAVNEANQTYRVLSIPDLAGKIKGL